MKQELKIVPLDQIEFSAWRKLWQGYQAFYNVTLTDSVTISTWQRLNDPKHSTMYGFAATMNDRVIGIVHVIEHESCWTLKPYAYLQDLFTDQYCRGQGVAKALINAVQQAAEERECDRVYWLTHQDNHTAQLLYDRIAAKTGFIQYRLPNKG